MTSTSRGQRVLEAMRGLGARALEHLPRPAEKEALALWALAFFAILVTWLATNAAPWPLNGAAKLVATVGFLYLPGLSMRRRGEDFRDYGLSARTLPADLRLFAIVSALVFPLFVLGYLGLTAVWDSIPPDWLAVLTPYKSHPHFALRLPDRFPEWVIDNLFVVALPEEFFYRGFLQRRFRDAWPQGRTFLGGRLGPAFWLTAVLFALGHLATFKVYRLGVFFPALIFGWMRERTGSVVGAALFHACANLLVLVLDASFFGS